MGLARYLAAHAAVISLLLLCCTSPAAHAVVHITDLSGATPLNGLWKFKIGDDPSWSDPELDSSDWAETQVPAHSPKGHSGYSGMLWYRLTLQIDLQHPSVVRDGGGAYAITLGNVMSAYEVYAGGQKIGQVGQLNSAVGSEYDRHATWSVPVSAVDKEGRLLIALRVWGDPSVTQQWQTGPYYGEFLFGNIGELQKRMTHAALWPNVPLALIYLVLGLYHLLIARRNPGLREFAWFGGLCIFLSLYTMETSQAKFFIDIPYFWHKKIEYLVLYLAPLILGKTLIAVTQTKEGRVLWAFNIAFLLLFTIALIAPEIDWMHRSLRSYQYLTSLWAVVIAAIMAKRAYQGSRAALGVVMILVLLIAALLNDVILTTPIVGGDNLLYLVFVLMMLGIAVMMAERYTEILRNLEDAVNKRTVELSDSNRALENALDVKSQFLANMSHEMRTPMNAIIGLTNLGLATDLNAKQRSYFSQVEKSGEELLKIIESILSFSNLSGGAISLLNEPFDMSSLLADVREHWSPLTREAGLQFKLESEETWPQRLVGDISLLRQVLDQLISNAIKFTQKGDILLSVQILDNSKDTATVRFAVTDTGIGIAESQKTNLFETFSQADNSSTRAYGGTGIGLSIVQRILALMDASLDLDTQPSRGSTFSFDVIFGTNGLTV